MTLPHFNMPPNDVDFVQNPYDFYARAHTQNPMFFWEDYGVVAAAGYDTVNQILKDRRFGRECPKERVQPAPAHLKPFYDIEAHSMLELEPPRHTRLRGLVLRAFTSRRVKDLKPIIEAEAARLIGDFPATPFDLLEAFARPLPVRVIASLLGVPQEAGADLLRWSNAMVAMYQSGRTRAIEDQAATASRDFVQFLSDVIAIKEKSPTNDLISDLIRARDAEDRLNHDELISTIVLLLNAGHEATVHTIGNGVRTLMQHGHAQTAASQDHIEPVVEEILRFDPPLHIFQRFAYEKISLGGHVFQRGEQVSCLLAAANRDPMVFDAPNTFDPARKGPTPVSFGAGLHFCVGAPLARLELSIAFQALFSTCPTIRLARNPEYADIYHFHGLKDLMVQV